MFSVRGKGRGYSYQLNESHSLAQEHMLTFVRKSDSSPGTGTHQKLGARRGCFL